MALTLSNVLVEGLRRMGALKVRKATGGSTTTIADSTLVGQGADSMWKDGSAFIIRDAGGAAGAPEGQFQRISAYVDSTGTFTVDTAFTTAVASGDVYGFTGARYPLAEMIECVNGALAKLGDIDLVDTTTLDTAVAQTEYAAAVAWKRARPYRVDIQTVTGDSNDNWWKNWADFDWVPAAAGSTGLIVLSNQPVASRDIRVWYKDKHPALAVYSDVVHETFAPETVYTAFKAAVLEWIINNQAGGDPFLLQEMNTVQQKLENAIVANPVWRPKRRSKLLIVGTNDEESDQFTYPT